jgi:archaellum component FlaC
MKKVILIGLMLFASTVLFGGSPQDNVQAARARLEVYKQNTMAVDISQIEYAAKCSEYDRQLYRLQGHLYTIQNDFTRIQNTVLHRKEVTEAELTQMNELQTKYQELIAEYERVIIEYDNYVKSQN